MGTIDKDIRELREKTGRTRYQFLRAELQTCFTSAEQRREVETKLAELNEILDPLKGELSEQSR